MPAPLLYQHPVGWEPLGLLLRDVVPLERHSELAEIIAGMAWRDEQLEHFLAIPPPFLRFNLNGAISVSSSDFDPMGYGGRLHRLAALLTTTGTSTTTVLLKHTTADGATTTTVATFNFTSGNRVPTEGIPYDVNFRFKPGDWFWTDVTAAGTGAEGLVLSGWGSAG